LLTQRLGHAKGKQIVQPKLEAGFVRSDESSSVKDGFSIALGIKSVMLVNRIVDYQLYLLKYIKN
jgi:hypothetical protein